MIVTAYRPRLEMSPLSVYCTACHAKVGEQCTTMNGHQRLPHAPREKLAGNPLPCPSCGAGYGEPCRKASGALSLYPHRARLRVHGEARGNHMEEVNYIVFAEQGLVKYRFALDTGNVHEFEDLEVAVRFAETHDVHDVDVVFPDGDVHTIMIRPRFRSD